MRRHERLLFKGVTALNKADLRKELDPKGSYDLRILAHLAGEASDIQNNEKNEESRVMDELELEREKLLDVIAAQTAAKAGCSGKGTEFAVALDAAVAAASAGILTESENIVGLWQHLSQGLFQDFTSQENNADKFKADLERKHGTMMFSSSFKFSHESHEDSAEDSHISKRIRIC